MFSLASLRSVLIEYVCIHTLRKACAYTIGVNRYELYQICNHNLSMCFIEINGAGMCYSAVWTLQV